MDTKGEIRIHLVNEASRAGLSLPQIREMMVELFGPAQTPQSLTDAQTRKLIGAIWKRSLQADEERAEILERV